MNAYLSIEGRAGMGLELKYRVGLGLRQTMVSGLELTCTIHKILVNGDFQLSGLVENWARAFSGIRLMYNGPSIEPGSTGSGLGPFQLYLMGSSGRESSLSG